jgi:hypothetical protein
MIVENPSASARRREQEGMAPSQPPRPKVLPRGKTALSLALNDHQMQWLTDYCIEQYLLRHNGMNQWRQKMKRYERMAEEDRTDRVKNPDRQTSDASETIFDKQNETLGLVSGFADFGFAQARDDLFGSSPWFAGTPQGGSDIDLADDLTKYAHWKFSPSNMKECLTTALKLAADLGTAFPKISWRKEVESYERIAYVACSKTSGSPIATQTSDLIEDENDLPEGTEPEDVEWKEMLIDEKTIIYDNVTASCVDYHDISFNPLAPELDLIHTDVFQRMRKGLLDVKSIYGLTDEQYLALQGGINATPDTETARHHRDESYLQESKYERNANPPITIVEGFMRCDPIGNGDPIRIYVVFSPDLKLILHLDYLANTTPGGVLPIFPIRWYRIPNRVIGVGYFERYEKLDNFIDQEFNTVVYRNRMAGNPITGVNADALAEDIDYEDILVRPGVTFELKSDKTIADLFSFAVMPDTNNRTIELMNIPMQIGQMRTGITSSAQGELKGVPSANTATGTNQLISRGATLLKWPIDNAKDDLTPLVGYSVNLLLANMDRDETFAWGEGKDAELVKVNKKDVRKIRLDVAITMSQSQSQQKLQATQVAIGILQNYLALPEQEKTAARPLFVEALKTLDFNNADQIIRDAAVDAASIAAMLPKELQAPFMQFMAAAGQGAPPTPDSRVAPVSPAPSPVQ